MLYCNTTAEAHTDSKVSASNSETPPVRRRSSTPEAAGARAPGPRRALSPVFVRAPSLSGAAASLSQPAALDGAMAATTAALFAAVEVARAHAGALAEAADTELAALSRQLAAAHARLRQLGEEPPAAPGDALASGEDSPRTPASAPRTSAWGSVFGGGARA